MVDEKRLFYYAFIMGLNYNNMRGYLDMYNILSVYTERHDNDVSPLILNFQYYCLAKAHECGASLSIGFGNVLEKISDDKGEIRPSNYFLDEMKVN